MGVPGGTGKVALLCFASPCLALAVDQTIKPHQSHLVKSLLAQTWSMEPGVGRSTTASLLMLLQAAKLVVSSLVESTGWSTAHTTFHVPSTSCIQIKSSRYANGTRNMLATPAWGRPRFGHSPPQSRRRPQGNAKAILFQFVAPGVASCPLEPCLIGPNGGRSISLVTDPGWVLVVLLALGLSKEHPKLALAPMCVGSLVRS